MDFSVRLLCFLDYYNSFSSSLRVLAILENTWCTYYFREGFLMDASEAALVRLTL